MSNTLNQAVLARASSSASADPPPLSKLTLSQRAKTTGSHTTNTATITNRSLHTHLPPRVYKSNFKRALKRVEVPPVLIQGIPVIRVYANGKTPKQQYLTLSRDKFTLYITSSPIVNTAKIDDNNGKQQQQRRGSWFSTKKGSNLIPSVLKRNSSVDSVGSSKSTSIMGNGSGSSGSGSSSYLAATLAERSRRRANTEVRAIDIGAIQRIQRGAHHANLTTTTASSAVTVQNLTRWSLRSSSSTTTASTTTDATALKQQQQQQSSIVPRQDSIKTVSSINSITNNMSSSATTQIINNRRGSSNNSNSNNSVSKKEGPMIPPPNSSSYMDISELSDKPFDFKNPYFVAADTGSRGSIFGKRSSVSSSTSAMMTTATAATDLDPGSCFSIIFRGDWALDLMITDFDIMTTNNDNNETATATSGNNSSRKTESSKRRSSSYTSTRITRDEILDALDKVIKTYQNAKRQVSNDVLLLRYVWTESDQDKSNTIKPNELGGVLDRINYHMKKSELNGLYDNYCKVIGLKSKERKHGLTFEQTCTLLHKIKRDSWMVKPVHQYWNSLFGEFMKNGKPRMTVSDKTFLEKFLHKKQGERHATMKDVHVLFNRLNEIELPRIAAGEGLSKDPTRIDKNRFEVYVLGQDNDAFDPRRESHNNRMMHRPISEYWINSSHNTYLTGDQLTSNSSIDMYSNALYRGCKCLELDVWDGGYSSDGEPVPVVWHGHTMTSKILYKDIIKAIKLYVNFHPDTFPLILSYENHCSIPYQEVMAAQLIQILGDSLYIPKEDSLQERLPTPSDLRGMVVIKGRRPANLEIDDIDYDGNNSDDGAPSTIFASEFSANSSITLSLQQQQQNHRKMVEQKVCPALARLTLFHGTKLKNWDDSIMNPFHYMHSFSETKLKSLCKKTDRQKWVIYNQSHMSRSYPSGSRVDSSNYSPILPWALGVQLVAINFQTVDVPVLLNDGRFRENGGCGYVLKSTNLIARQDPNNNNQSKESSSNLVDVKLTVRVLSGTCLPKPNDVQTGDCINPYVKASVYDIRNGDKEISTTFSTSVVSANGFFPIWNGDKFMYQIENTETAMLQLTVYDKGSTIANATYSKAGGDEFIASASIPISCLRKGLRSVKLFDTSNTRSGAFDFASLLLDIKKEKVGESIVEEYTMAEI